MYRYIALAWNHQVTESTSVAGDVCHRLNTALPNWQRVLSTDGLHVYHFGARIPADRAYVLVGDAGVILGKVFKRCKGVDGNFREVTFDSAETRVVSDSHGRHLVERYWGRYVALLPGTDRTRIRILRDPTGAMPCLLTRYRGVDVVCSDVDVCAKLGIVSPEINWDHLIAYLVHFRLITNDTGLVRVRHIHAGECVTLHGDAQETTFYWTPDRIYDSRVVEDRHKAMCELRREIENCVGAWASCYDRILHQLSGGLDSSTVLCCLSRKAPQSNVICQNYFTLATVGDERHFAQRAAELAGYELLQTPIRPEARTLDRMLASTRQASPAHAHLVSETELLRAELATERHIDAIFSGQGGDHLFQQTKTPLIAAEYAWRHGLAPGLLDIVLDTARLTKKSVWSVFATVLASGILRRRENPYARKRPLPLLSDAARDASKVISVRHPWILSARHLPAAKIRQIFHIIDSQIFYYERTDYADIVHPLISQPIIEQCLQTPSYVLSYGGMDRALVRDAFSGMIPREITTRLDKGGTTSAYNELLVGNLPFLRQFLLDGLLVRHGLLSKRNTETSLTEGTIIRDQRLLFPIMTATFAESWLRAWLGEDRTAAA